MVEEEREQASFSSIPNFDPMDWFFLTTSNFSRTQTFGSVILGQPLILCRMRRGLLMFELWLETTTSRSAAVRVPTQKGIGKLLGVICDKHGPQHLASTMQEVTYLPSKNFNLFSCTSMKMKGWLLNGVNIGRGCKRMFVGLCLILSSTLQKEGYIAYISNTINPSLLMGMLTLPLFQQGD